jgi:hypothetical protein
MNTIETGDLIAVRTAHGIMGRLTQFFTRSPYTHVGVAIWLGADLFMAELNGGRNHLVPISQIKDFDVYARPDGLSDIEGAVRRWLQVPVDYGFLAFVAIGLLDWLRIKAFVHWRQILVCSGYCVAIYEAAGWPERSRIISPRELASWLTLKLSVRPA